jgi:hypothetical protein
MFDLKDNHLKRLKEDWPEVKWSIVISAITHCNHCNRQACPEIATIPDMKERTESVPGIKIKVTITPKTPPGVIALCSECGGFWWIA